ncbi:MAG: ribonuclease III [Methanoregulaceae archaeon]|nr:MAG: ribonuclease III [Methanoregulaceae archaeon]
MTQLRSAKDLEDFIDYEFKDLKILEEARRRRAYRNEHPMENKECMDPLATLGDAVLDSIVVLKLYQEGYRSKGKITEKKIEQVKHERTRAFAEKHNLGEYILWGDGEYKQMDTIRKGKAFDAVTEALIGAIFLDAEGREKNGLKTVQEFLEKKNFFNPDS